MADEISLRDVQMSDLPILFEHQLDPEATRMAGFPSRSLAEFMAHWKKGMADESTVLKTIVFHGEVAGNIVFWQDSGEPKVGYWLGRKYWGQGIASAALSQFLHLIQVRPLYARVAKHNIASIRVLEKCGFANCGEDRFAGAGGEHGEELVMNLGANRSHKLE